VDSATDGIITLDDEQRIILFNPSAEEIFGHKAAAIFTQPFNCLLPKRLRALQSQLPRNKLIAGEIGYPCRMRGNFIGLRANGEEFPMETSISEATIEEKSFFTLIVRDVAERQRTEETRARLAAIVESSHDAIIGKSLDGTITNWNKGAELLFGFAAAEIIGNSSSIFIPRDRLEEEMHLLARWQRHQTVTRYRARSTPRFRARSLAAFGGTRCRSCCTRKSNRAKPRQPSSSKRRLDTLATCASRASPPGG
jgi:PAS domain S-box-containing protein